MNVPQPPLRRAHLASYLRGLIQDVTAQGKVAKINGNPVEIAAVAIMSGSIAVVQTMWEDITALSGDTKSRAKTVARPMLENVAAHGMGLLFDRLLGARK